MKKNKGGRPPKEAEKKRNKRVFVNFTPEEHERALKKAKRLKMPLSAFLRASAEGAQFKEVDTMTPELLRLMAITANNFNQIAKRLNQGQQPDDNILRVLRASSQYIEQLKDHFLNQD